MYKERTIILHIDGKRHGECTITGSFDTGETCSVTISIDKEYQGHGYSYLMWKEMILQIEKENPSIRPDQMFFIDADASAGYWDHIGFTLNRYGYDYIGNRKDLEGRGYEKVITFRKLKKVFQGL
jgi:hypothetical protein